jgi:Zn-dependent protease with chaperone function
MKDPLVTGSDSLRYPSERHALAWCILFLPASLALVAGLLSSAIDPSRLVLIAIGALLYVSIGRGRLLGDSIHVHGGQLANVAKIVEECAGLLDVPAPQVFVRDDNIVPIASLGIAEPYAIVISSHWLKHLSDGELRFLIARELVHIRIGHTRLSSILSVNGRENPAVSLVFGAYLRRTEYTADRAALCCCGSLKDAVNAIAITSFHNLAREINLDVVAEQLREIRIEPTLRAGEWLGSSPYAARRIADITVFASTALAQRWTTRFAQGPVELPRAHVESWSNRAFASWWRRVAAWVIDYVIMLTIAPQMVKFQSHGETQGLAQAFHAMPLIAAGALSGQALFMLWAYSILLVAVLGRTVGMMILDVRVVSSDLGRPTVWAVLARYILGALSLIFVFPLVLWGLRRVQPYDRLSGTRLVSASAVLEPRSLVAG